MRRIALPGLVLLLAVVPLCARAGTGTPAATPRHTGRAVAPHQAGGAKASPKPAAASRTLKDVHIEGEIPVPQVLFITTQDPRRFMDFQHHRYLSTSVQLGAQTALPAWIAVTPSIPETPRKEISR